MGTINNIYVLNYLVNKQLGKKKRLVALFVDLKATFDSVNRKVLTDTMRGRGTREGITGRVVKLLRETRSRVRVRGEMGESFWTARDVRQGCPLNPLLFTLLIVDMEEEMRKIK